MIFFSLVCCCGDNNPLKPLSPPELIPLAKGASWEYRYYYAYHGETPFTHLPVVDSLSGNYIVSVQDQITYPDSTVYFIKTSTVPDNDDSTETASWWILFRSDSLWIKGEKGDWAFMAPSQAPEGVWYSIKLDCFVPWVGEHRYLYNGGTDFQGWKEASQIRLERNAYGEGIIDGRGVSEIKLWWYFISDLHPENEYLKMQLESFVPGNTE